MSCVAVPVSEVSSSERELMVSSFLRELLAQEDITDQETLDAHHARLQEEFAELFSQETLCIMDRDISLKGFVFLQKHPFGYHVSFLGVIDPIYGLSKFNLISYILKNYPPPFYAHVLPNNPLRKLATDGKFMGMKASEVPEHPAIPANPRRPPAQGWIIFTLEKETTPEPLAV